MSDSTVGPRSGSDFGPYHLRRLIERGRIGEVYEATNTILQRVVAVTLISQDLSRDDLIRQQIKQASWTAARLSEPHVLPVQDLGEIEGQMYLETRMVDATDLGALIERYGPLTPPRAVNIIRQVAMALDAVHSAGIIHGDVTPEHILIAHDDFVYLKAMGIVGATTFENLMQLGVVSCKYTAPERFTADELTNRADIYALACVLYECMTGSPPFSVSDLPALITAHMTSPIPRPSEQRQEIPACFDDVIARGMAKNPQQRYTSAGDLAVVAYEMLGFAPDRSVAAAGIQPGLGESRRKLQPFPAPPQATAMPAPPTMAPPNAFRADSSPKAVGDHLSASVFAPPSVRCGENFLVYVFAHIPGDAALVESLARKYYAKAESRGSVGLSKPVNESDSLAFELLLPGVRIDEPVQSMVWFGRADSVQFGVTVPDDFTPQDVWGTIRISRESVPMGHLKFNLTVLERNADPVRAPEVTAQPEMQRYKRAFISYASADRTEVLKRTQMLARNKIEFFQDILSIDPGERWERRLYREIDRCDVFFLFWSSAAKRSPWVIREVQYAMERSAADELAPPEIVPIVIEGPPPIAPPPELAHLHFNDQMIYLMKPSKTSWLSGFRRRKR